MHISGKFLLGQDDPINDPIKLDEREMKIIELLCQEPNITRAEMARQLECSDSTVKRALQSMTEKGAIKRVGSNKKGGMVRISEMRVFSNYPYHVEKDAAMLELVASIQTEGME